MYTRNERFYVRETPCRTNNRGMYGSPHPRAHPDSLVAEFAQIGLVVSRKVVYEEGGAAAAAPPARPGSRRIVVPPRTR